jgi:hypothetical protein
MPEADGYLGVINLLSEALKLMDEGKAKDLVEQARAETVKQARQSVTSLEMGIDLGRLLREEEDRPRSEWARVSHL